MNDSFSRLDRIQNWMQSVITHPLGVAAGIESQSARQSLDVTLDDIEQVIRPSRSLDSVQRLAVYGSAYFARLLECLGAEYPAVRTALGDEAFRGFAAAYVHEVPPASYTLAVLGRDFPQFLAASRPPGSGETPDFGDFVVDLARLERAYNEVFDGPGEERCPKLSSTDLESVPPGRWGEIRIRTSASLRLLQFRFPVHEYATAVRRGGEAQFPRAAPTRLAVHRRDYVVRRRTISPFAYRLLERLMQGEPLGAAIESAVVTGIGQEPEPDVPVSAGTVEDLFNLWTREGYIVGVDLAPESDTAD